MDLTISNITTIFLESRFDIKKQTSSHVALASNTCLHLSWKLNLPSFKEVSAGIWDLDSFNLR